jgi:glycerophosphoryl diester phosphodiesterase
MRYTKFLLLCFPLFVCAQKNFDIEGHRGARGLYPENTIVAFIEAIKLGVNTLEMDVVVSKDGQLVVSHDPYMNPDICKDAAGNSLQNTKEKHNLYQLTYSEIQSYDCGSYGNAKFPEQQKIRASKPLLSEVIDTVEKYLKANNLPRLRYNIETKSTPDGDNKFHPAPAEFSKMLYDLLKQKEVLQYCIVQSFDPRTLQEIRKIDASVTLAFLVFNAESFESNLQKLGFVPNIYSPNFMLVNKKLIRNCHSKKIQIIPWTVNEPDKMKKLKAMGVDGLITDYPDRAMKELR